MNDQLSMTDWLIIQKSLMTANPQLIKITEERFALVKVEVVQLNPDKTTPSRTLKDDDDFIYGK